MSPATREIVCSLGNVVGAFMVFSQIHTGSAFAIALVGSLLMVVASYVRGRTFR